MQLNYMAPQRVQNVIADLGRTEDVKFSPNNLRIAVAEFSNNKIALFDISVRASPDGPAIKLPSVSEITSQSLNHPHGVDFIDEEKIIVANRDGSISIFQLPPAGQGSNCYELLPLEVLGSFDILNSPGSVAVVRITQNLYEALICNNYSHSVTRHLLDFSKGCSVNSSKILLSKWLDIPDGICVSKEGQWIAISNHSTHCVLLYHDTNRLNELSSPDGILGCVYYPHGLKFTSDDQFILVADAGSPHVHIYGKGDSSWQGVRNPLISLRTMNDDDFLRGRYNPQEGGPKGIDITNDMTVFVTTSECQPLAFFDLRAILGQLGSLA